VISEYRVTLFKRKIREIIGADWIRFYYSKGKCHLCIGYPYLDGDNATVFVNRLSSARIEHKVNRDIYGLYRDLPYLERPIGSISIPIDQEALPELRRAYS
jgi:hypothetical protein